MSGLLAARVLSEHFNLVTIVERDRFPAEGRPRRGVPQGRHGHALLPRGSKVVEALFPGFLGDLVAAGVPVSERLHQMHLEFNGHLLFRGGEGEGARRGAEARRLYQPTRPFLEARVRERVRGLANIAFMEGCDIQEVTANRAKTRATRVRVAPRGRGRVQVDLPTDLVVAATGRSGRAATWLRQMGYAPPPQAQVPVALKYVTQRVRLPAGSLGGLQAVVSGPAAARPWGGFAFAQEDDQWTVTFYGYTGHHPPTDRSAWLAFEDAFLPPAFAGALRRSEPLEDLHEHRFPANLRRHYERLSRFPEGFLVTGAGLCSFNPIYGQGMTVAALEALALRESLRGGWDRLAHRFFKTAAKPVGDAWRFAVGGDLALPATVVPGVRSLPVRTANRYLDRFQAAAENDPVMAWRFLDVTGFEEPAGALFGPDSLRRLASDRRARRRTEAAAVTRPLQQVWP